MIQDHQGIFSTGLAILLVVAIQGCSFAPRVAAPELVAEMPQHFVHADTTSTYQPSNWWISFEDPVLNRLIDSTLASNMDLVEAVARLAELRALYKIERSALFPVVQASVDGSLTDQPANSGFGAQFSALTGEEGEENGEQPEPEAAPRRISFENFSSGLSMSYELDFWGRVRNSSRAALSDYLASEADLAQTRLVVINQAISTYMEVVDLRRRIAFNVEVIDVLTERVAQTRERYDRGLVTSFELYATLQDYRNTQSNLPLLERQLTDAEGRLAVIAGTYAGKLDALLGEGLNPLFTPGPIPSLLPAELLNQRPDIQAAAERLEAARYRIGARKAERFPTVSPTGTLGLQGNTLQDLVDLNQWYINLAAGITAPLFQGGRLKANVEASEARYIQQAAAYTRTILTAFQEAESALSALEEEQQRFEFLNGQREEAQSAVVLQAGRYESGVGTYLDYLDALRTLYNVETNLSLAARDLALARLGVHRALGGNWKDEFPETNLHMVPVATGERP